MNKSIKQDRKYPVTVYKYRYWEDNFHKKILTENQLFLASPKSFNDPFDCRINSDLRILDSKKKIDKFIDNKISRLSNLIKREGEDPEVIRARMLAHLTSDLKSFQNTRDEIVFKEQDKYLGVICLSRKWDNILMWSHYANSHTGFCVGFDEAKLRNSSFFSTGGVVNYDEFPKIDPREVRDIEMSFKETHFKAEDWISEGEYRLTKLFYPKEPSLDDRIIQFPNDFIVEIILGINISTEDEEEIINISNDNNIPVFRAKKMPFEFKITREPV